MNRLERVLHDLDKEELIRLIKLPNHLRNTMLAVIVLGDAPRRISPSGQVSRGPPRVTT